MKIFGLSRASLFLLVTLLFAFAMSLGEDVQATPIAGGEETSSFVSEGWNWQQKRKADGFNCGFDF